jgi:hypothetical protein
MRNTTIKAKAGANADSDFRDTYLDQLIVRLELLYDTFRVDGPCLSPATQRCGSVLSGLNSGRERIPGGQ